MAAVAEPLERLSIRDVDQAVIEFPKPPHQAKRNFPVRNSTESCEIIEPKSGLILQLAVVYRLLLWLKGDFRGLSAISHILQISALGDKVDARRVHHERPIIAFASATSGAFEVPT
jgi:hypothetical protein